MKAEIWEIFGTEGQHSRLCVPVIEENEFEGHSVVLDWISENFDEDQQAQFDGINFECNAYTTRRKPFLLRNTDHHFEDFLKVFLSIANV